MLLAKNRLAAGWELHQQGALNDAESIYRTVVRDFPKREDAWIYFGMSLNDQARFNEALAAYDRALAISSDNFSAWTNRGNTLGMLGNHQAALESHQKALELSPAFARGHTNLGVQLLRMGQTNEGWRQYEWRTKTGVFSPPSCTLPFWHGESLNDKHLIIHGEQGLGDEIQTARYAATIINQGGRVTLSADKKLQALFKRSIPACEIRARGEPLPDADYQICGLSLPRLLGYGMTNAYLEPDPKIARAWAAELCHLTDLKVGVSWCGNPQNPMNRLRSIELAQLITALSSEKISIISLQAVHGLEEIEKLGESIKIHRPLESLDAASPPRSIDEMAAIISNLDLVITCDSICAHLAPALGVETWLLAAAIPDWRWGLSGTNSPWYDHIRLFRQNKMGSWQSICHEIPSAIQSTSTRSTNTGAGSNELASELSGAPSIERHTEQVRGKHGNFHFLKGDRYIGKSLQAYGEFSEFEVSLFDNFVKPGNTVVEVGANIGTHTIPLAQMVRSNGTVLAFEPQRYIFELLAQNSKANKLTQIVPHRMALADLPGEITVPVLDPALENNFGGVPLGTHESGDQVPVSTIDALNLSECALIKADVEGMEIAVIKGARETIAKFEPTLYLENDREDHSSELVGLIKGLRYRVYLHAPPLFNPDNFFKNNENLFGNICSINILCIPISRALEIRGLKELT